MGCADHTLSEAHLSRLCGNQVISKPPDQEVGFSICQASLPSFLLSAKKHRPWRLHHRSRWPRAGVPAPLGAACSEGTRKQGHLLPPCPPQPAGMSCVLGTGTPRAGGRCSGHTGLALASEMALEPWLVWLSGWSASLKTKGLPVQFPVRAHAWVAGQVPSRGHARGNHTLIFLSPSFSFPSPLSKNK